MIGGLVSGLLAAVAFRSTAASALVFIALVPLLRRIFVSSCWPSALAGWVCGLAGYAVVFDWLPQALERFQAIPPAAAWASFVAGVAYQASQVAIFAAATAALATSRATRQERELVPDAALVLATAALWVAIDWAFPKVVAWSLGGALASSWPLRQAVDLGGEPGLSFLVVLVNACVTAALVSRRRPRTAGGFAGAAAMLVLALWAYGAIRLATRPSSDEATLQVGIAQAAMAPEATYGGDGALRSLHTYEALTDGLFRADIARVSTPTRDVRSSAI